MRAGSLFSGVGGLDLGLHMSLGCEPAWFCEIDKHCVSVLNRHWPDVPVLPDVRDADELAAHGPIDVLHGGYPCQPFSHAGNRKGADDPRHLWPAFASAIRVLRPRIVVGENVAGHLTLGFDRVLGDLAEMGMSVRWGVVRASDTGAPHQRARLFWVAFNPDYSGRSEHGWAVPTGAELGSVERTGGAVADSCGERHGGREDTGAVGLLDGGDAGAARQRERARPQPEHRGATVAANTNDGRREQRHQGERRVSVASASGAQPPADADELNLRAGRRRRRTAGGDRAWPDTSTTPDADIPGRQAERAQREGSGTQPSHDVGGHATTHWGAYEPAIRRWEAIHGTAPRPTDDRGRLMPAFVNWMMGFPPAWVDGPARTHQLRMLGNAVVPAQAALAMRLLTEEK